MGFDMFDHSCQSSYLLTGKDFETVKRHATGVFQHTKTASSDGQVFLNICTARLLLLSLSFPFAPLPYTFPGPKGACQLCPLEDLRRGCRHRLASAGDGGNGGTFPPAVVEFFCVGVLATRLKFRICCESLWPFIQAGFRGFVGNEIRTQDFNGKK